MKRSLASIIFCALAIHAHSDAARLTWTPNTEPDLSHYNVYRATASTSFTLVNAAPLVEPVYLDSGLAPATTYTWRVTAVDDSGNESAPSESVSTRTLPRVERPWPGGVVIVDEFPDGSAPGYAEPGEPAGKDDTGGRVSIPIRYFWPLIILLLFFQVYNLWRNDKK